MIKESLPSIWASMLSWYTPTVLFVLINIVIGTIVFSTSKHRNKEPRQLSRLSSVFENLRSFNLNHENTEEIFPPPTTAHQQPIETIDYAPTENRNKVTRQISRTSSIFESLRSFNPYRQNSQEIIPPPTSDQQQPIETVDHAPTESQKKVIGQISRSSSIFESLRSFNLYRQNSQEEKPSVTIDQHQPIETVDHAPAKTQKKVIRQISRSSSIFESLRSFNLYRQKSQEEKSPATTDQHQPIETVENIDHEYLRRSQSDNHPTAGERQDMVGQQMKKAASAKWGFENTEVKGGAQRPATVRERGTVRKDADEEVDARADDFISKFKQQLKLQRLDSMLRYKDMLNRGK
ncbi:pathogen-associated molecular patterns-induced protein A70-like [Magnolia sinica]|uniref:pathogen-associated molecular patterns-induced protein A70-like n=1 Tax=Magnolia sinica TaxID=86752 RepID=UPI0026583B0F|nr:pathogen-associated molecular patterns-induced protein A70-like [Magnolia sinica]